MTESEARANAIAMIGIAFNQFQPQQAALYARLLADIPPELLEKAVQSLLLTLKFPPTVSEIRSEARNIYRTAAGIPVPDAGEAWGKVLAAVSSVGYYRTPHFDDPYAEEAIKRFGWQELCQTPVDEINTARAQFMRIYKELAERRETERRAKAMLQDGRVTALLGQTAMKLAMGRHEE